MPYTDEQLGALIIATTRADVTTALTKMLSLVIQTGPADMTRGEICLAIASLLGGLDMMAVQDGDSIAGIDAFKVISLIHARSVALGKRRVDDSVEALFARVTK
jgi:hypothetical protein